MYLIHLTYQAPLTEVDKYLQAHREFLDYYYKQGLLIASGPLTPRTGGIVLAVKMSRDELNNILSQDPFQIAGITTHQIYEFTPVKHCEALTQLIQQTEGQLC
jgi:uncharacterized protein YciI